MGWVIAIGAAALVGLVLGKMAAQLSHNTGNLSGTASRESESRVFWSVFVLPFALVGFVAFVRLCLWTKTMWHAMAYANIALAWTLVAVIVGGTVIGWVKRASIRGLLMPPTTPAAPIRDAGPYSIYPAQVTSPTSIAGQPAAAGLRQVTCPIDPTHQLLIPQSSGVWCPVCQDTGTYQWIPLRETEEVR